MIIKRLIDLILIFISLPFIIPVIMILCIVQKLYSKESIFFHQERIGLNGKSFFIHKFRTMDSGNGPDEDRLTKLGKFLRSTSLDELPEILNIIKGEMSFVGPRPLLKVYQERYSNEQKRRHLVLPGITGWAQINGRNSITWEHQFKLDCWYVENQSIMLDLKILFLTIGVVIKRKNINAKKTTTRNEFLGSKNEN